MKRQTFIQGGWRAAGRSRALRYGVIIAAAVAAGLLTGRALSDRGETSGLEPGSVATAGGAPPVQARDSAAAGTLVVPALAAGIPAAVVPDPEGGSTVSQVVQIPPGGTTGPGFIQDIPNADFTGLTPEQKKEATRILNERGCNCNCQMTLAQCRRDDKSCPRSPEIVARFVAAIRKGDTPEAAAGKMYAGTETAAQPQPGAPAAAARPADSGKLILYKVEPGTSPSVGPAKAPVTIIEFLDYQCPFCARGDQIVKQILQEYKDKVRLVFKHHPLPMHPQAGIASEVALAAHEQGRFLQVHDRLFAAQRDLAQGRERILALAKEAGADAAKLTAALDSGKHRAAIEADSKLAGDLGATGTPAFFINGRFLSGARPYEQFKVIIDEELAGKRPPFEWGTNVRAQQDRETAVAQADQLRAQQEEEKKIYQVDLKNAVSTGPERAPVTIVEFTDYQCPFCQRVQPALKQLLQEYKGKVRLVTKNLPLAFHAQARPAARAALAAHKQGKYWEFRDLLFANNRNLADDQLVAHATALGLKLDRFRADMASPEIDQLISADERIAQEIGATGTPTFLINGRKLVGAQPLEAFKQRIDSELASSARGASPGR